MKNAVTIYWSTTGNTEKVAFAIKDGLKAAGVKVTLTKTTETKDIDYFDYDLVCVGCPSIQRHPPKQITEFLLKKFEEYRKQEKIKTAAPKIHGKNVLVFCTYSGSILDYDKQNLWACMLVSSLSTSDLQFWMNGIYSASSMA